MEYKLNFTSNIDEIISKAKELDKLVDNTDKSSKDAQKELLSTAENLDKELKSASKGILDANKAIRDMRKTARESGKSLSEQEAASMLGVDLKALRSALKTYTNIAGDIRKAQESAKQNIEKIEIAESNEDVYKILGEHASAVKKRTEGERKAYEKELELVEEYREDYENLMSKDVDLSIADIKDAKANKDFEALSDSLDDLTSYRVQLRNLKDEFLSVEDGASKFKNEIEEIDARLKSIQTPINQAQNVLANRAKGTNGTRDSLASTGENIKNVTSSLRGIERDTEASVKRMGKSFSKLGDIIKSSFVDSLKTGATAVKKYFGLLAKAGKSIFNLIKKGFGGGSESSNPLINMFKKGIVFYGVKKLIGELQNFISTTANIGTVADSAFAQYNGHLASVKENLRTLGTIGATGLIQALTPILNVLNFITSAAVNAAYAIADLLGFGGTARKAVAGYNAEAKAISGVGAAAKKATLGLQSFDKLNNTMSDKSSGGGGGGGISNAIEGIPYEDNKVIQWLKGLFDLLSDKKWQAAGEYVADGINSVSDALYNLLKGDKIEKKLHKFNDGLTDFFKGLLKIDTNKIGKNIGLLVNKITYAITDLYNQLSGKGILKGFGAKISQFFNGIFDEVDFRQLGQALMVKFKMIFEVLRGFLDDAKQNDLGTKLGTSIKNFILGVFDMIDPDEIGSSLGDMLNLGFDALIALLGGSDGISLGKEIGGKIVGIFNTAIQTIDPKKMSEAFSSVLSFFGDLFGSAKDWDTDTLSDNIANAVNDAADNGSLKKIASGITTFLGKLVGLLAQTVSKINWINVAKALWQGIVDGFNNLSDADKEAIVDVLKTIFEIYVAAKAGLLVLSKLGSAILGGITNGISTSPVGALADIIKTKLGSTAITAAGAAAGATLAFAFVEDFRHTVKTEMDKIDFEKSLDENINLTNDAWMAGNTTILGYVDSLNQADEAYRNLKGNADSLRDYLNKLEAAGFANTEEFKKLKKAVDEADDSVWDYFSNADLDEALNQASDFESKIWGIMNTLKSVEGLTVEEAQHVVNALLKVDDATFTPAQVKELVDEYRGLGKNTATAYVEEEVKTFKNDQTVLSALNNKLDSDSRSITLRAIQYAKDTGSVSLNEYNNVIKTDSSTKTALLDFESSNYSSISTQALKDYHDLGKITDEEYAKAIKDNQDVITDATSNTVKGAAKDAIPDAQAGGEDIGKAMADGGKKGIEDNKKSFINALTTIATAGLNMVKSIMGIHSPSKVFRDEVGQNIVLGMIEGISDEEMAVQDEMQNIRDVIMQPFDKRDMSEYFDFSGIPSSIVVNPSVNKARLQSGMESSGSTAGILGSLGMLGQKAGKTGQKVQVSVYLDANNKLGDFILDTVSGQVVKGGNF